MVNVCVYKKIIVTVKQVMLKWKCKTIIYINYFLTKKSQKQTSFTKVNNGGILLETVTVTVRLK